MNSAGVFVYLFGKVMQFTVCFNFPSIVAARLPKSCDNMREKETLFQLSKLDGGNFSCIALKTFVLSLKALKAFFGFLNVFKGYSNETLSRNVSLFHSKT